LNFLEDTAEGAQHPPLLDPCLLWPRSPISATAEPLSFSSSRSRIKDLGSGQTPVNLIANCKYQKVLQCCYEIIRPNRRTVYVDAAYCYRPSSVICLSVCLVCLSVTVVSSAKMAEPIEMPNGTLSRVDPRKHLLDGGPDPRDKGKFWEGRTCPNMPDDTLPWAVHKRLNQSRCHVGRELGWAERSMYYMWDTMAPSGEYEW